ncbi:MAG TPA: TonB-dependent receptor, partial [Candidatus Acidoferrales bacterium]|nr:TonB-dependent receptor [Candidatus Acidoferrales bacterium]
TTYDEYAVFGNATWHFTDRFDVQFGGRYAENRQKYNEVDSGPALPNIGLTDPFVVPRQRADDGTFTFLVAPRFRYTPDLMMYARIASGYRPGGINAQAPLAGLPPTFDPDKTINYELGIKALIFDGKLSFDASLYYIDWKDVQLSQQDVATGISFFTNGGKARSTGAEFALSSAPLNGMTVTATLALDNAELRSNLPPAAGYGFSGDQLPFSAPLTATVGVDQQFHLGEGLIAFAGGLVSYSGERKAAFPNTLPAPETPIRNEFPNYTTVNLRAGLIYEDWRMSLFAQNVGDEHGIVSGGPRGSVATQTAPYGYFVVQPRTYGLSLAKDF